MLALQKYNSNTSNDHRLNGQLRKNGFLTASISPCECRTRVTWGLQYSSIQLKVQAESSWKLLTDTELLNDWNSESMMLWKMLNLIWSDTCSSPCWGLFW